jgi:hypothetical protein
MATGRSDNSLDQTKLIRLRNGSANASDRIGGSDRNDFYQIRVNRRSPLNLNLGQLSTNANLALLNAKGKVIQKSTQPGTQNETIQRTVRAGTYFVRVFPGNRRGQTNYRLTLSTSQLQLQPQPQPQPRSGFNIQFDYRFDTQGWFTPERRAALEAAATIWENIIQDDFPDTPVGKLTPSIRDPQTNSIIEDFVVDVPIDDVMIFVGSRGLGESTLAQAAPSGFFVGEERYDGSDFEPWLGSITFSPADDLFFDPTPNDSADLPSNQYDFITLAAHEIGHVLGFGTSDAYDRLVRNQAFAGSQALSVNGGNPIPVGGGHIQDGYEFGGSGNPLMTTTQSLGRRERPTLLDIAVLDDIGHTVNYSAAARNASAPPPTRTGRSG